MTHNPQLKDKRIMHNLSISCHSESPSGRLPRTHVRNLCPYATRFLPLVEVAQTPNDSDLYNIKNPVAEFRR